MIFSYSLSWPAHALLHTCFSSLLGLDLNFLSQELIALDTTPSKKKKNGAAVDLFALRKVNGTTRILVMKTINIYHNRLYIYMHQDFPVLRATQRTKR